MSGYPGAPVRARETATVRGTRNLSRAFPALIIGEILAIAFGYETFVSAPYLDQIVNQTTGEVNNTALPKVTGFFAAACGLLFVFLIGFILALLGLWAMYKGRSEYGGEHEKNVNKAALLIAVAIVLFILSLAVILALSIATSGGLAEGTTKTAPPSPTAQALSAVISVAFAITISFLLYLLVKSFLPPEKHDTMVLGIGLFIMAPIANWVASSLASPPASYFLNPESTPFNPVWLAPAAVGAVFNVLAMVVFFMVYYRIYERLKKGEIKPIWETMKPPGPLQYQEVRWQPPPRP